MTSESPVPAVPGESEERRVTWKVRLEPFAQAYAAMATEVERLVEAASDDELRVIARACKRPAKTNCWWATYDVAPLVLDEVRRVQHWRRKARRDARRKASL